jgi:signal transduction histidine kinase
MRMSGAGEPASTRDNATWDELTRERQAWRERALRGISWSILAALTMVGIWFILFPSPVPQTRVAAFAGAVVNLLARFVPGVTFSVRTLVVLLALYGPCAYALLIGGYAPNPFMGLGLAVVMATLLLGRTAGLTAVVLSVATVAAVCILHRSNPSLRSPAWADNMDSVEPAVALRVAMVFGLISFTIVVAVTYLLARSDDLLRAKAHSLDTLRAEQAEKERIARDLELREAAFHKGRELELLGRLAGTMAHDFNNGLLVIWSALDELAVSAGLSPTVRSALAAIRTASDQAAATTRQLRAFGPMGPRRASEVSLAAVVGRARAMFARVLPQNIRLAAEVTLDAVIVADEGELLRVLMNLALNARDAMRDGGDLTLRVRPASDAERSAWPQIPEPCAIDVADTGAGMSDEVKARLFEPFFTTKHASGTGLGLASVREIVEALGGRVAVASELDQGTTISLFLPTKAGARRSAEPTPLERPPGPAVVLLVDDDVAVRGALTRGLTRLGMTVIEASDGAAALTALRRHHGKVDVLCTDCVMAGLPVRQLIAGFRELGSGKVIVCSGYAPSETGLSSDIVDEFLPKPFAIEELAKLIGRTLG